MSVKDMALVDEVKSRSDIVQVISDYVDLDTSSRQPKALCPFHSERSPSFVIYPESGSWRCFGSCADGGDVISFMMKKENLSFVEALENLANRAGIKVEERNNEPRKKPVTGLIQANEIASEYFLSRLKAPIGVETLEYLKDRGIDIETAVRRGLGLAPSGMETLSGHLRTRNVQARTARDAGLITRKDDGSWRDMFTGRLTIEIRDARDRIIGYGARTLDGSEPKYLNTPQTDAFDKSSIMYGLNWAAESIRDSNEAVVVEGYMDVITAHEHGFTNVVASMGTAVTAQQLDSLSRHATSGGPGTVILCLDSDAAGEAATMRALESVTAELNSGRRKGLEVKVARPDGGKDPDEAIRSDPDSWRASLTAAEPLLDYLIVAKSKLHNLESGQGIADFANSVAPLIYNITNDYDQDRYWSTISKLAGVTEQRLKSIVDKPRSTSRKGSRSGLVGFGNNTRRNASFKRGNSSQFMDPGRISSDQVSEVLNTTGGDALEEHLLALVLQLDDLREHAIAMPPEFLHQSDNRALFTAWQSSSKLGGISPELGEDLTEKAHRLAEHELPPSDQARHVEEVTQCVMRLRERHSRKIKVLEKERLEEYKELDSEEAEELLRQSLLPNENLRKAMTGRA
ncbi:MAG: DNA primase [Chloroflexi bacterium]|nr:DNA primase [Chloroflexota bacterium]MBT7079269.1 DNA primase [Chloroflexota bacterium]